MDYCLSNLPTISAFLYRYEQRLSSILIPFSEKFKASAAEIYKDIGNQLTDYLASLFQRNTDLRSHPFFYVVFLSGRIFEICDDSNYFFIDL